MATIQNMLNNVDDDLIMNAKFRARGVKTGFYGFDELLPFKTLDDLKQIARNLPKQRAKPSFK